MVRMISSEGWPARVSDDQIIGSVGQRTFLRGRSYVRQGRVRSVNISAEGDILTGQVRGSGGRVYQTMVYCHSSDDPRPVWTSSCSCPVGTDCKHAVAVLLTARRQAVPGPVRAGSGWEGALADLLRVSDSDARPMALEVGQDDSAGDWPRRRRGLSLLPLVRGRNGWNRQGASWSQVLGGGLDGEVDDDVLQAVQEIGRMVPRSFYYSDDRVSLDDVPRRFWGALRRGVAAGLALTTAQRGGRPVRVSEGLRAGVSLRIAQDDSLVVAPALNLENVADLEGRVADNPPIAGIGSPIHGFVVECLDGGLVLMPIEPAPSEVLARLLADTTRRITVPPSDVPRFKSEYLEPLSRAVPVVIHDPRIDLPEPAALHAVLRVTIDGAAHRARTEWLMRYRTSDGEVRREEVLGDLDAEEAGTGGPPAPQASPPRRGRVWAPKGRRARTMPRAGRARAVSGLGSAGGDPVDLRAPRDLAGERRLAREIIARLMPLVAKHGELWKRLNLSGIDTAHFMVRTLPVLKDMEGFETEVVGEVPDYREADGEVLVTTDVDEDADRPDWFSLKVHVKVGDEQVPIARLMAALANGDEAVLLDSGAWIDLDRPEIRRLAALMAEGRALAEPDPKDPDALRVSAFQAGYYAELVALGVVGRTAQRWRENVERLLALRPLDDGGDGAGAGSGADPLEIPAPAGLNATLRPYQLEGYQWLDLLRSTGLGGILADDMGLGKTVQILAAIQRMLEERRAAAGPAAGGAEPVALIGPDAAAGADEPDAAGDATAVVAPSGPDGATDPGAAGPAGAPRPGPVLVIAPTSVVGTWVEQAGRFCPDLRVRAVTRTSAKRGTSFAEEAAQADVLVTSYTIARLDEDELVAVDLSWLVLDEAQFIKNHASATYKAVRRLRAPSAVAITGTPLENSLMDLWSLLSVSAPGLLPGPDRFTQHYRRPIERGDTDRLEALRAHMRPFLLRRTKEEVAADLPDKSEQVLAVELPPAHRRAYDARLARERQKVLGLLETDTAQARFSALRSLTILRQMALDPALVETGGTGGSDAGPGGRGAKGPGGRGRGAKTPGGGRARRRRPTAKIEVLLDTLRPVVAEGHRALVFSQFTRYLTGVREHLEAAGLRTAYLDGATVDRQGAIDSFRSGEADVFLISLKAGGFGLTLTEADYVFLLDPWWNPQVEEQAVDRAHRIGQDKPVMVYRLVSADTIEEKVMDLKEKKAELFDRVVEGAGAADEAAGAGMSRARLTAQEIRELVGG